jgi:hypothetical protein
VRREGARSERREGARSERREGARSERREGARSALLSPFPRRERGRTHSTHVCRARVH